MNKQIVKEPNTVLHAHAAEIPIAEISSKKIRQVIQEMKDALRKTADGIGIAAPQIGYSLRIFLASEEALRWKKTDENSVKNSANEEEPEQKDILWEYYVFVNPVIIKASRKKSSEAEGCLSVPGTYGTVSRADKVTVETYDEQGNKFIRGTSGLYARVIQHEIDHLNGILFISKAHDLKKITRKPNQDA